MYPLGRDRTGDPFRCVHRGDKLYGAWLHNMKSGVADNATAIFDVRYPPPYEPEDVSAAIEVVLKEARSRHPDSSIVSDIRQLVPTVSDFEVKEIGIASPYLYCGNDTTHLSRAGIECCLLGPRGEPGDTERHVLVSEMVACARTLGAVAAVRCA